MADQYGVEKLKTPLNLMAKRMGVFNREKPKSKENDPPSQGPEESNLQSVLDPALVGIDNQRTLLGINGGSFQQERMIFDKRRTLDRVVLYSYQGALIKKLSADPDDPPARALINPNKNKFDYDDKILSVEYEYGIKPGDVFLWVGTNTYWLVYLQELTELAYFRGEIRKCSYEISWEDEDGVHSTYAAVRGPVETKINFIQKHQISIDEPNYSLHFYLPRTEAALKYFRRYSKFYLQGTDPGSPAVCWRVEATDWISTPGILEITAVEYFINETEDDVENGLVGKLIAKPINPNTEEVEAAIVGDTFIKPKQTYEYHYQGPQLPLNTQWKTDKKYPVDIKVDSADRTKITLKWRSNYSGQMELSYGNYTKTIVIESLF